jgi:hypothetical protein
MTKKQKKSGVDQDRQGEAAQAGAAHPVGRLGEVVSREAACRQRRLFDNRLIFGGNLLTPTAMEAGFAGKERLM